MGALTVGEWFALASLLAGGAGVYVAIKVQLAAVLASVAHMTTTIDRLREDLVAVKVDVRRETDHHGEQLHSYGQRIARLEAYSLRPPPTRNNESR